MNTLEKMNLWFEKATKGEDGYFLLSNFQNNGYGCIEGEYSDRIIELKIIIWKENTSKFYYEWKISEELEEVKELRKITFIIKNNKKILIAVDQTPQYSVGFEEQNENVSIFIFFRTEGSANFIFASDKMKKVERWDHWQESDSIASFCLDKLLSAYKTTEKYMVGGE